MNQKSVSGTRIFAVLTLVSLASVYAQGPAFNNTPFRVKLTSGLDAKLNKPGDQVTAQVLEPAQYKGALMEGTVKKSFSSGKMTKKSELEFVFQTLNFSGQNIPVSSQVTSFTNSKGTKNTDEEGQIIEKRNSAGKSALIGGAAGAVIGGLAGGGKGAAIGAGAGAGVGLLFASFGVKGPNISFAPGSEFTLSVTTRR